MPDLVCTVDEYQALVDAPDRSAQIVAFGDLSTAINAIGDAEMDGLLRQIVIMGGRSDELGAIAFVNMASHMLSEMNGAAAAFPAEVRPMLALADEFQTVAEAGAAEELPDYTALSAAVEAIGNDDLSAMMQDLLAASEVSLKDANDVTYPMIGWIMTGAVEAADAAC
jgi:hypothetical protein